MPLWTKYQGKYRIWEKDWRRFARQLREVRRMRFDLLIGIRFDPREVLQLRLLNARETAGFGSTGGRHWVTRDIGLTAEEYTDRHRNEVSAHTLEALTGLTWSSIPHFRLDEAARTRALRTLRQAGYRGGPILAVHGGAGHPIRCRGDENFSAALRGVQDVRVPNTIPSCQDIPQKILAEPEGELRRVLGAGLRAPG